VGGVWNKLYKTELIQKQGIVYHEGHIYEDFAFIGEYIAWAKYGYCLDGYYYNYRLARTDAITTSASRNKLSVNTRFLRLFEEIYAYYARFDLLESHAPLLAEMLAMMLRLCAQYSTDYVAFLREARQFVARYPNLPDTRARTFWYLGSGKAFVRFYPLSPLEKVFSVVNAGYKKIFRILGFEFAVDRDLFKRR
jgi:hypothetical protein